MWCTSITTCTPNEMMLMVHGNIQLISKPVEGEKYETDSVLHVFGYSCIRQEGGGALEVPSSNHKLACPAWK